MPELPEVETVRRGLEAAMVGRRVLKVTLRRKGLRFAFPRAMAHRLEGKRIEALSRRAKYILARIEDGNLLLMHLGMSGRFTLHWPKRDDPGRPGDLHRDALQGGPDGTGIHDHVIFDMENGIQIIYTDHRRFGVMDLFAEEEAADHRLLKSLGVEPLGADLTPFHLNEVLANRKLSLKSALLDQRIIAGLGNIYACEVLFRAGLCPRRPASSITASAGPSASIEKIVSEVQNVLTEAIEAGGSTLRDYAHTDGELGYFQHRFKVYDREGQACLAPGCREQVRRLVQSGRSTFYCPGCQK